MTAQRQPTEPAAHSGADRAGEHEMLHLRDQVDSRSDSFQVLRGGTDDPGTGVGEDPGQLMGTQHRGDRHRDNPGTNVPRIPPSSSTPSDITNTTRSSRRSPSRRNDEATSPQSRASSA